MTALIIGGSRGIGLEIARAFAHDRHVFINYLRDDEQAALASELIHVEGGRCTLIKGDVGTPEGCDLVANAVRAHTSHLDQVVHSAVMTHVGSAFETDAERFTQAVAVNGMSLLYITQAVKDLLHRGSSIFYLSSRGGRTVIKNYAAIGVGKALAESLVRYLAVDLASQGIRINAIAPGIVETDALRTVFGEKTSELVAEQNMSNPSGRGIRSEDYTQLIRFLASPAAEYITGQTLFVNGGANLHA